MRPNTLKQKLNEGKPVFGAMLTFPSATAVEMLGYMGFDWVLLDNEHGSVDVASSEDLMRAAELTGVAPIVRPVANRADVICPFLDRGAWGVQVPHVNTRAEAEAAVAACKYFPEGVRGIYSKGRPAEYGMKESTQAYAASANANTLVCLMLEEVEAINNIDEITQVRGIDVLFIGSGDLSQSMGFTGQQTHPEVLAMMERGVKRIRAAGVHAGVSCPDAMVPKFLDLGVRYFHGNVTTFMQTGGEAYLKHMRKAAGL
jgi:4-hydroxy-2-oxoheptanedioate aldolase